MQFSRTKIIFNLLLASPLLAPLSFAEGAAEATKTETKSFSDPYNLVQENAEGKNEHYSIVLEKKSKADDGKTFVLHFFRKGKDGEDMAIQNPGLTATLSDLVFETEYAGESKVDARGNAVAVATRAFHAKIKITQGEFPALEGETVVIEETTTTKFAAPKATESDEDYGL